MNMSSISEPWSQGLTDCGAFSKLRYFLFYMLLVWGFELRALRLLGRHSTS
jgi:hypothetical protein